MKIISNIQILKVLNVILEVVLILIFTVTVWGALTVCSALKQTPEIPKDKLNEIVETIDNSQNAEELRTTSQFLFVACQLKGDWNKDLNPTPLFYPLIFGFYLVFITKIFTQRKVRKLIEEKK